MIYLPTDAKLKTKLWVGWIAGALLEAELANKISKAGFEDFTITWRGDIFRDAPQKKKQQLLAQWGLRIRLANKIRLLKFYNPH